MSYEVVHHDNPAVFLERAEAWLRRREDLHNLVLGLAYSRAEGPVEPGALFATVEDVEGPVGCVIRTPPHKVLVTELPPESADGVARVLAAAYDEIPAVFGPATPAEAVAAAWTRIRGGVARPGSRNRIYRLDGVTPPVGVPGRLRQAGEADAELSAEWTTHFGREVSVVLISVEETVRRWIESGALFVWDDDGPVSICVAHGRTPAGIRIGYVFTPPELRGRGYASACVAAVSQRMLDRGLGFCVLFTDLANPTSNALYQKLGYYPLADFMDFDILNAQEPT